MYARGPSKDLLCKWILQPPFRCCLSQEVNRSCFDPFGLGAVDVESTLHRPHASYTRIFIGEAAKHVVKESFAKGAFCDAHGFDPKHLEYFREYRQTADENRHALFRQ